MPFGKTAEEKAAAAAAKQAQKDAQAAAQAEAAYWRSPVGQAAQAKIAGNTFFQLTINVSTLKGRSSDFLGPSSSSRTRHSRGAPDLLGQIEDLGWHLEHVGYVFVETGTSTRGKMLSSGEQGTTSGYVEGIYLFRNVDDPEARDPTVPRQVARVQP